MVNILEGLQFREPNPHMPSWNEKYGDWKDAKGETVFSTGTQFRLEPKFEYVVRYNGTIGQKTPSKTNAMASVSTYIEQGFTVSLEKLDLTMPSVSEWLSTKKIQYQAIGQDKWVHGQYFSHGPTGISNRMKFRLRPDTYFQVDIKNGIVMSTLEFDDVDKLSEYLDRQLRTSENNIVITRRSYGLNI